MSGAKPFSTLRTSEPFNEAYAALDVKRKKQTDKAIRLLFANPAHPGLQTHPINPDKYCWEAYINRSDRLIFVRFGSVLRLVDIVPHDDIDRYAKAPAQR
ncbi:MAG TPA: hypothetical protein VHG91_21060 [Longimicrobium sp.]|nr:hypothetical protein [Longimicrobium sp.]